MNKLLLLFCFVFLCGEIFSQSSFNRYPGYIIFKNNDTFRTKILIDSKVKNIELADLYQRVSFIDSNDKIKIARPEEDDIIEFSFKIDTTKYFFYKISIPKKNKTIFSLCLVDGYIDLYCYYHFAEVAVLVTERPGAPVFESADVKTADYYFQNSGQILHIPETTHGSPDKRWLKSFFRNDKSLCDKIGKEINIFDLETMVKEYNNWHQQNQAINK